METERRIQPVSPLGFFHLFLESAMKNSIFGALVLALVVSTSAFGQELAIKPEPATTQPAQMESAMVVTVDGQPVTDETQLLKLRIMIGQAGIAEPVLVVETWTAVRSNATDIQLDAFTSIVTTKRFVERVSNQDMRGMVWKKNVDDSARRQRATQIAVPDSWRVAIERLSRETPVDTASVRLGRVVVDGVVFTDSTELTKLRILVAKAGVEQEIMLIETTVETRHYEGRQYDPQVDGMTTIATANAMIQRIPSGDVRNTRWKAGDAAAERRASKVAIIDSWERALNRLAQENKPKVFVQ